MPQIIKQHPEKTDHFLIEKAVLQYEEFKKEKPDLKQFHQCMSAPIAVLGGGPSLPKDMEQLPKDCIKVSANHHAYRLCTPEYMCFLDNPIGNPNVEFTKYCKEPKGIRVSYKQLGFTDIYTINEFPKALDPLGDSGMFATWFACYITSGHIYLCGMGLRIEGEPEHFYDEGIMPPWGVNYYDNKVKKWEQVFNHCENRQRIKAISGPLTELL